MSSQLLHELPPPRADRNFRGFGKPLLTEGYTPVLAGGSLDLSEDAVLAHVFKLGLDEYDCTSPNQDLLPSSTRALHEGRQTGGGPRLSVPPW